MLSNVDNIDRLNSYVKLNVGGALFYTTIGTLLRGGTMLSAMFSGRMEVKTDEDGWVLIDRSGKHFGAILNYIRDGTTPLPESKRELEELSAEARYFCVEGLWSSCDDALNRLANYEEIQNRSTIIIVKCPNAAKSLLSTTKKPVVKLTMNRYNNVFSYTSNSHDNLLRNIECLEKYALMFPATVLFVKDVRDKSEQNEICEWSYYCRGHRLKSIDCIAIHYSSEKRLIKVEFPESRIHEEMLSLLSVASRNLPDAELVEIARRKANCSSTTAGALFSYNSTAGITSGILHDTEEPELDQSSSTSTIATGTSLMLSGSSNATPYCGSPPCRPNTIPLPMMTSASISDVNNNNLSANINNSNIGPPPSSRSPFGTSRSGRKQP